jgi:RNA polymerase sigma-70 factor (ECF subfamily)
VRAPDHDDTDARLINRIAEGDHDALVDLYGRHAAWILVRLRRRCAVEELVANALQDTFVSAWRSAPEYRVERGAVGAWLWTIAVRRLVDQLRRRAPPTPVDDVPDTVELPPPGTPADELLAGLAPELQGVVEAVYLDGLTVNEAALLLGIPAGTVKSRLSRARTELTRTEWKGVPR